MSRKRETIGRATVMAFWVAIGTGLGGELSHALWSKAWSDEQQRDDIRMQFLDACLKSFPTTAGAADCARMLKESR